MKEFVERLLPLERDLFFALNGSDSMFLDNVMWTLSGRLVWIPMFLVIIFLFFYKTSRKEAILVTVFFILVFVLSDQVSSSIFKPLFERFRPTHHPDFMDTVDIMKGYRGGKYGFISGHATNSLGLSVFISLVFKYRWVTISSLLWATLNSYTRIYLGVHFIADIIAGMIVGAVLAFILYYIYKTTKRVAFKNVLINGEDILYNRKQGKYLAMLVLSYSLILIIFSPFLSTLPH